MTKPAPVVSSSNNTCWALIAGHADPRHLYDIIFAVHALRKRGVPEDRIWVFTDHPAKLAHFTPYGITNVVPTHELASTMPTLPASEVVMVVATGHGDPDGISVEVGPSVNPTQLLTAVRACPGVRAGAIVLSQCYAGLFNYVDAGDHPEGLDVCLIGATRLNLSLSIPTTLPAPVKMLDGTDGLSKWAANVFFVGLFEWLLNPRDVDGDGRCTLMDAYKHAAVKANEVLRGQMQQLHLRVGELQAQLRQLESTLQTAIASLQTTIAQAGQPWSIAQLPTAAQKDFLAWGATQQQLEQEMANLYVHQEPWVLHARLASAIEFQALAMAPVVGAAA